MKLFTAFIFSMASMICLASIGVRAQAGSLDDPDKAKLDSITKRVRNGEKTAILEAADIKPDLSVPVLSLTAQDRATDPEKAELAIQALTKVKGVEDYLKQKIDAQSGKNSESAIDEKADQLDTLSLIRTNKAIRVIASYLFDDKDKGYSTGDSMTIPLRAEAAAILDDMNLTGAPSNTQNISGGRVAVWRAWWLKNQGIFSDSKPYQGNKVGVSPSY